MIRFILLLFLFLKLDFFNCEDIQEKQQESVELIYLYDTPEELKQQIKAFNDDFNISSKIPNVIYSNSEQSQLLGKNRYNVMYSISLNENFEYKHYNDSEIINFYEKLQNDDSTDPLVNQFIDTANLIQFKNVKISLWKYIVLYLHGGIYIDTEVSQKPQFLEFKQFDSQTIIEGTLNKEESFQEFVKMAPPKHPLYKQIIQTFIKIYKENQENVEKFNDFQKMEFLKVITGNQLFNRAFMEFFGYKYEASEFKEKKHPKLLQQFALNVSSPVGLICKDFRIVIENDKFLQDNFVISPQAIAAQNKKNNLLNYQSKESEVKYVYNIDKYPNYLSFLVTIEQSETQEKQDLYQNLREDQIKLQNQFNGMIYVKLENNKQPEQTNSVVEQCKTKLKECQSQLIQVDQQSLLEVTKLRECNSSLEYQSSLLKQDQQDSYFLQQQENAILYQLQTIETQKEEIDQQIKQQLYDNEHYSIQYKKEFEKQLKEDQDKAHIQIQIQYRYYIYLMCVIMILVLLFYIFNKVKVFLKIKRNNKQYIELIKQRNDDEMPCVNSSNN